MAIGTDGLLARSVRLGLPRSVEVDATGNLYILESTSSRVRKVTADGILSTVVGSGTRGFRGFSGDGGPATSAKIAPMGLALDTEGNLYIADTYNNRIRKVTADGVIHTLAGNERMGFSGDNGAAGAAELFWPHAVAVDRSGSVYIADTQNNRIRRIW